MKKPGRENKTDMIKIKVLIDDRQKLVKIPTGTRLLVRKCCSAVLRLEGFSGLAEVSVSFVDDVQIRELNRRFRDKDSPTDVLSFPMGEPGIYEINPETGATMYGDIVISMETAVRQAERFGHSMQREVGYLTVHSMLHLIGYDHEQGGISQVRMREKEEHVLSLLGYSRDTNYVMHHES